MAPLAASAPPQLTGSSRFQPGSDLVIARLTRRIDRLLALFQSQGNVASDAFIDSLMAGDTRSELFRMESLLRLYRHKFPNLTEHLKQVKAIEDGLGEYSYAVDSLNFAKDKFKKENQGRGASADQEKILEGLEKKRTVARGILANVLEKSALVADLRSLRSQAGPRFRGWGSAQDMPFVKKHLQEMLKKVRDETYDFTRLEDGIHEFRRQLRWFPMTIDGLDGLIVVRDDPAGKCPVPALQALAGSAAARNKYANPALRFPAAHPCAISRCLLWQVSKTVRDLGRLKDDTQGNLAIEAALDEDLDVSSSNVASPAETARARAIRTELNSSRALDSLMSQISSCRF
jgi:hypothetical protein